MPSSLKILFWSIHTVFFLTNLNAQSKKEQIEVLSKKIDSLNSVINNERSLSLEKTTKLNTEMDLISKKLIAANDELIVVSRNFDKKKEEAESIVDENRKLESDLNSLKEENSRLQFKLDSLIKANCVESLQSLNKGNIPPEVSGDQACIDCNWYEFDRDSYEEGDLIFIHISNLDQLFFILCDKSYCIPLTDRKFNERFTETGKNDGNGTLIFQGDGIKVVYSFYQEGHVYGSEGNVQIFKNDKLVKKVSIRATL